MTATTITMSYVPRFWGSCLNCYNNGYLVGDWFDCTEAGDVDLESVHRGQRRRSPYCEEIWCLDVENLPVDREMDLLEAAKWGEVFEEVGEELWPALCAWVRSGCYVAQGTGDIPSVPDFLERCVGHWESFREYAEDQVESTGMMAGWSADAQRYFNWDSWTRDLRHDYTVEDAPDGGVYVFRNL